MQNIYWKVVPIRNVFVDLLTKNFWFFDVGAKRLENTKTWSLSNFVNLFGIFNWTQMKPYNCLACGSFILLSSSTFYSLRLWEVVKNTSNPILTFKFLFLKVKMSSRAQKYMQTLFQHAILAKTLSNKIRGKKLLNFSPPRPFLDLCLLSSFD